MGSNIDPKRGEVWMVDFGLAAKVRPALVITIPYTDDDRALIGVVPHTRSLRGSDLEIKVNASFLKSDGAFLLQGFATVPPKHFIRKMGSLNSAQLKPIEDGLRRWQGL